jgi:hypothetical protein
MGGDGAPAQGAVEYIRSYYDALRAGDPLAPYFADGEVTVKFGISETLRGGDAVRAGLRGQTATTTDWHVDSRDLVVDSREDAAWFADDVFLAWTDTDRGIRFEFDTRWSGTLVDDGGWDFVAMHVSTAEAL